ncbi:zinc-dependent metalloprotease [Natrialbaceae archaeon AArc-T1-2]|uniref:zinc-dependent metalloprotease n=1 Tax=Natrialbaceae archaeon AArc-T1-2 TaxID=3053904 RepID=UPI00255AE2F8|nr:zinc-dependent metalloprotease [Natrialbaceae archaeon AArc-T1-2]WIV67466.1 zinc-dependent metalloprotease [Natrialbaceae archaeon AArc-T1-2]
MNIYRSARAVAGASGDHAVDWAAAAEAAKASTEPGSISLEPGEREGYARDVRDARREVRATADLAFEVPDVVEIQNRHHWMDANIATFERVMAPVEDHANAFHGVARTINTGTMTVLLAFLGRNVLGQYDPLLLADTPKDDHALYFVRPNILRVAEALEVEYPRFRRWIAFHEVTHAAEFGAAPWLSSHLEANMQAGIDALAEGSFDKKAFRELDATMTVVEGYAELLMDHAFDDEYADLRRKLDERRQGRGPLQELFRRLLGLGLKRRQYERGKTFFEEVADARGLEAAGAVWEGSECLPTHDELDEPGQWLRRVDP